MSKNFSIRKEGFWMTRLVSRVFRGWLVLLAAPLLFGGVSVAGAQGTQVFVPYLDDVVFDPPQLVVREGGPAKQFTIRLASDPGASADVGYSLSAEPSMNDLLLPSSGYEMDSNGVTLQQIGFTSATWNTPITFTVSANMDNPDDDTHDTVEIRFQGISGRLLNSMRRDDDPAIPYMIYIIDRSDNTDVLWGDITQEDLTLPLNTEIPTIELPEPYGGLDRGDDGIRTMTYTIAPMLPAGLTFTPDRLNSGSDVTDADDADDIGARITGTPTVAGMTTLTYTATDTSDPDHTASSAALTFDITVEGAEVVVDATSLATLTEGENGEYTVVLGGTAPDANVEIGVSSDDTTEVTTSPAVLTFTTGNWNVAQTVTVSALNDDPERGVESVTISHAILVGDSGNYSRTNDVNTPEIANVEVQVEDVPGTVRIMADEMAVTEGGTEAAPLDVLFTVEVMGAVVNTAIPFEASGVDILSSAGMVLSGTAFSGMVTVAPVTPMPSSITPTTVTARGTARVPMVEANDPTLALPGANGVNDNIEGAGFGSASAGNRWETLTVTLGTLPAEASLSYGSAGDNTASVRVNEEPKVATLGGTDMSVPEDGNTVMVPIEITGGHTRFGTSVAFDISGTATPTVDYNIVTSDIVKIPVPGSAAPANAGTCTTTTQCRGIVEIGIGVDQTFNLPITILNDNMADSGETLVITLLQQLSSYRDASETRIVDATVVRTLTITEAARSVGVTGPDPATANEGESVEFVVDLTGTAPAAATPYQLTWTLSGMDANDFPAAALTTGTLDFTNTNWNTARTVTVATADDNANEGPETLTMTLSGITVGADIAYSTQSAAVVFAANDPIAVSLARRAGDSGTLVAGDDAHYVVSLDNTPSTDLTVTFSAAGGSVGTVPALTVAAGSTADPTFTISAADINAAAQTAASNTSLAVEVTGVSGQPTGATAAPAGAGGAAVSIAVVGWEISLTAASSTVPEGSDFSAVVTQRGTGTPAVMVPWAVTGSGTSAAEAADFGGTLPSGTVNLATAGAAARTITFTTASDTTPDDGEEFTLTLGTLSGTDADKVRVTTNTATATIVERGVSISTAALTVEEGGEARTYDVQLIEAPSSGETVTVTPSSDNASAVVTGGSLTFTDTDWNAAQTVTVSAPADDNTFDDTATISHAVASSGGTGVYSSISSAANVVVTLDDSTAPAVTIAPTLVTVTEEGASGTYTVVLATNPTANVIVTVSRMSGSNLAVGAGGGDSQTSVNLTFTATNWNTAQTVSVGAGGDANSMNETETITHTVSGGNYADVTAANVMVTINDNDVPGIRTIESSTTDAITSVDLSEGDAFGYRVVLQVQPSGDVTVAVSSSDTAVATVAPATLTFTSTNWNTHQSLTVTSVDIADNANTRITHTASGANYADINASLAVMVTADGLLIAPSGGNAGDPLMTPAGASSEFMYTVRLTTMPDNDVTVTPSATDSQVTITPASVTFTPTQFDSLMTFTVTASVQITGRYTINHAVAGYGTLTAAAVDVSPSFAVSISPTALTVEEGGAAGSYSVQLVSDPGSGVVRVRPVISASDSAFASVAGSTLVFNTANWNVARAVSVTGARDDGNTVDDVVTVTHIVTPSGGGDYAGVTSAADVVVTVEDSSAPGVSFTPRALIVSEGDEAVTATYAVVLNAAPDDGVMVTVTPSVDAGGSSDVTLIATTGLTFTASDWDTAQMVSISVAPDDDGANDSATISHAVSGTGNYASVSADDVAVTVDDDEMAGLVFDPSGVMLDEGESGTYTVRLGALPVGGDGTVTVAVSSTNTGAATVPNNNSVMLTFTTSNWNAVQTVTVTAADITGDARATLSHTASGADYADVTGVVTVDVTADALVLRNSAGAALTTLSVAPGGAETYQVRLATEPDGDVTVTLSAVAPAAGGTNVNELSVTQVGGDEVTIEPSTMTFTRANWNTPQPATLTVGENVREAYTVMHTVSGYAPEVNGANNAVELAVAVTSPVDAAALDVLNRVVMPEVARAVAGQQTDAIARRVRQAGHGGGGGKPGYFNFGGQSTLDTMAARHAKTLADDDIDWKRMLGNSDFVLPLGAGHGHGGGGGGLALWGGGDYRNFGGDSGAIDWDGTMFSINAGADMRLRPGLLAGLMMSYSDADIEYDDASSGDTQSGDWKLEMTSVNPFAGWSIFGGQVDMWATAGYGTGDLEITPDENGVTSSSDVNMRTLGLGADGLLRKHGESELRLKAEIFDVSTEIEGAAGDGGANDPGITQLDTDARRLRVMLESTRPRTLSGGARLTPSAEIGMRRDAGDGQTGTGAEVGGGLHYNDAARGLTLEGRARALLGHSGDYDDWGISGSVRVDAGADGQGLSLSFSPGYGHTAGGSGIKNIWDNGVLDDAAASTSTSAGRNNDLSARLDTRIGYGLPATALGDHLSALIHTGPGAGLLTPYTELSLGEKQQSYRLGLEWALGELFDLKLVGERSEGDDDDNAVLLRGEMRF